MRASQSHFPAATWTDGGLGAKGMKKPPDRKDPGALVLRFASALVGHKPGCVVVRHRGCRLAGGSRLVPFDGLRRPHQGVLENLIHP